MENACYSRNMIELTPAEARVLGVLIEKGFTTPNQYPLSMNAIANGANQLSNRDPVMQLSEDQAFDAAEALRNKGLAVRVDQVGSRVHKYKHIAVETLRCRQAEVAIMAGLPPRGAPTVGGACTRGARGPPVENPGGGEGKVGGRVEGAGAVGEAVLAAAG